MIYSPHRSFFFSALLIGSLSLPAHSQESDPGRQTSGWAPQRMGSKNPEGSTPSPQPSTAPFGRPSRTRPTGGGEGSMMDEARRSRASASDAINPSLPTGEVVIRGGSMVQSEFRDPRYGTPPSDFKSTPPTVAPSATPSSLPPTAASSASKNQTAIPTKDGSRQRGMWWAELYQGSKLLWIGNLQSDKPYEVTWQMPSKLRTSLGIPAPSPSSGPVLSDDSCTEHQWKLRVSWTPNDPQQSLSAQWTSHRIVLASGQDFIRTFQHTSSMKRTNTLNLPVPSWCQLNLGVDRIRIRWTDF